MHSADTKICFKFDIQLSWEEDFKDRTNELYKEASNNITYQVSHVFLVTITFILILNFVGLLFVLTFLESGQLSWNLLLPSKHFILFLAYNC